ncbi:MAG: hypothetical protein M3291_00775 [Actinomycetota bacterium]|nr:hypothetical protein [Actinomycetota bacterium]
MRCARAVCSLRPFPHHDLCPCPTERATPRLCLALRHWKLTYPNDTALRSPRAVLADHALDLLDDHARRFVCSIERPAVGAMLVDSLYLPTTPQHRLEAARQLAASWVGSDLGVPIRRIVTRRTAENPATISGRQ